MEKRVRFSVPVTDITFVLRDGGTLKLRRAVHVTVDPETNKMKRIPSIVAVLSRGEAEKELHLGERGPHEPLLEIPAPPGEEARTIRKYFQRLLGNVQIHVVPGPAGYHVKAIDVDHPTILSLAEQVEKMGQPATYGVHALFRKESSPLIWVPALMVHIKELDVDPNKILKHAKNEEELELAKNRLLAMMRAIEKVEKHIRQAKAVIEHQGVGVAVRYLRNVRDRRLGSDEDYVVAIIADRVLQAIRRVPPPGRGEIGKKRESREKVRRLLERELKGIAMIKRNLASMLKLLGTIP